MMFKLKDGIENPITVRYMETHGASRVYTKKTFEPGKLYGFDEDDELARETLLKAETKVKQTQALMEILKDNNIEYKLQKPTCNCQKSMFVVFCPIEEVEE